MEVAAKQHLANLQHAVDVLQQALQAGQAPDLLSLPAHVKQSLALTLLAATALLVMLVPRTRKLVLETAEAVLTIFLLFVLIGIVLGMPVGVLYLSYRGLLFLATSVGGSLLAHVPALDGLAKQAQQHLQTLLPTVLGLLGQHGTGPADSAHDPAAASTVIDGDATR